MEGEVNVKKKQQDGRRHIRPLRCTVSSQTLWHLQQMAAVEGCGIGRAIDKLVREKMLSMRVER